MWRRRTKCCASSFAYNVTCLIHAAYELGIVPPGWKGDERLPAADQKEFTPTPKQMLYGQRCELIRLAATETLGTFVAHAGRDEAVPKLFAIAADPARPENLRRAAVDDLVGHEAAAEVGRLTALLADPPAVTWALHIAVLGAAADLDLPAGNVSDLEGVDNLFVQAAVAKVTGQRP